MKCTTIEMASQLLEGVPTGNTVRAIVKAMLVREEDLAALETSMNTLLQRRLSKKLLRSRLPVAVDITETPYYGHHEAEKETVRRGRAKSGTTHFHSFATLYVIKKNKRYTLAMGDGQTTPRPFSYHIYPFGDLISIY